MSGTVAALATSSLLVLLGVPRSARHAFRHGWFERGSQTRRLRSQRRPTHGGLVVAVALGVGALWAGPSQPAARAVAVAAVLAVASGWRAERARGPAGLPFAGRVAIAIAVPLCGVRAELMVGDLANAALTAVLVLVLVDGLRNIQRSDGTMPAVVAAPAVAFLVIAFAGEQPAAPVAAALAGTAIAVAAYGWPPAVVRLGVTGPPVLAAALVALAVEVDPAVAAPRSLLVPILALGTVGVAALIPSWDRRLRRRGLRPHVALPVVSAAGALAAERLSAGSLAPGVAFAIGVVPLVVLAIVGTLTEPPRPDGWVDHRTRNALIGGAVVVGLVLVAAVAGRLLVDARRDMVRGREFATAGLEAARDGDLDSAEAQFRTADTAFDEASEALGNPAVRLGALIPGVGPNLHNARTLADVGRDLSSTAVAVAERAGADDLLVEDGRFPVEAARQVSDELQPALATLRDATRRLDDAGSVLLLDEVRAGTEEVADRVAEATDSIEVAAEATRLAPGLLGADGDRRWMVAVLTPSEQRGAGGLVGDFAELRAGDGDIELVRSIPASEMNAATDPVEQIAVLPDIYRARYAGYRVGRFWQNLSATPDVPTFGEAIAAAFPVTDGGGPVDGVIVLDPHAIAALIEITGPITVPDWPEPLTADNAAQVLLFDHYDELTVDQIDSFQSDVIEAVVEALTSGSLPPVSEIASVLGPQVAAGHLRLWSPEADAQALFVRVGADGRLGLQPDGHDYVQLITQNAGENKIDWFLRRAVRYEVTVDPATGALRAAATVTLENTAPASGVSDYIIGETPGPTAPGESSSRAVLFTPHLLRSVTRADGSSVPVNAGREGGLNAYSVNVDLYSGERATITFELEGLIAPSNGGHYGLVVGRQPAVVPDDLTVVVHGALGWAVVEGEEPREVPDAARTVVAARLHEQ